MMLLIQLKEPFRACVGETDAGWLPPLILPALLQEGDCLDARRYAAHRQGQLARTETGTWYRCDVLSAHFTQARQAQ